MASGAGFRHEDKTFNSPIERVAVESEFGPGFNWSAWQLQKFATIGSTIHNVSNCEDVSDWDISDSANFNAVNETTDIRTGSNAIELVDAGTTVGTTVALNSAHCPDNEDWSEFNWLCFWTHDDTALRTTDELKIQIKNNGTWGTAISVPVNTTADVFELKCINISGEDRAHVDGFRFVNNRGTGSDEKVYVDDIFVTDLITGEGSNTEIAAGPVAGPVRPFRIASGQTVVPGCGVNWELCEGHLAAANDTAVIGIVCQTTDFVNRVSSDTVPKYALMACSGAVVYCMNVGATVLGDGVCVGAGALGVSDASTNVTYSFARALETGTDNWHTAYQLALQLTQD